MAKPEPKKRKLNFENLDAIMTEVHALQENGYISHGNWSLAQASGHIAQWMRYPLDGFPVPPIPMRLIFWVMKKTVAPGMKRKILAEGFKGGLPTAPDSVPKPDAMSDAQGVEMLQEIIDRAKSFSGTVLPSPLFGEQDKAQYIQVTLLHAEHHLGYLEPKI